MILPGENMANFMKHELSYEEFISHVRKIAACNEDQQVSA